MRNKLKIFIKLILLAFFSLIWFFLIQAEYEMITKPDLQNDFPMIKGSGAVWFLGFILLVLSAIIIYIIHSFVWQQNKL
jgi:tryptophan-rich sensory protein